MRRVLSLVLPHQFFIIRDVERSMKRGRGMHKELVGVEFLKSHGELSL